jgi:hypothetical protein
VARRRADAGWTGGRLRRGAAASAALLVALAATGVATSGQPSSDLRALCAGPELAPTAFAARVETLGADGRTAALGLAESAAPADALCGLSALAAVRDPRVVAPLLAATRALAFKDQTFRLVRWTAFLAGGPDAALGRAVLPLVAALDDAAFRTAAGDDAVRLLGEIDDEVARDRLMTELGRPSSDAGLDATIHALARQAEPRARAQVARLGQDAVATRSGNTTHEQARRMGAVAFYQLTLGPETLGDGIAMLRQLAQPDQEDTAAWAVQTLCERAVRRPREAEAADRQRQSVTVELERLGVAWRHLSRGGFPCARG